MVTEVASKRVLCICVGSAVPCQMMERPGNEATIQSSKMKKKNLSPGALSWELLIMCLIVKWNVIICIVDDELDQAVCLLGPINLPLMLLWG